jgi:hypothetical protein
MVKIMAEYEELAEDEKSLINVNNFNNIGGDLCLKN